MQRDVLSTCMEAVNKVVLSVGSGDGSQQQAIVQKGLTNLQVTFHDSKKQLLDKYPHAAVTLEYLEEKCQHSPRFEVDATKLHEQYAKDSFDLVFFTFPHTGVPNNDPNNIPSNQKLLRDFLGSALQVLKRGGEIQITLKNGVHYEKWKLPALLERCGGLKLQSTHDFDPTKFPKYKHRLTTGMSGNLKEVPDKNCSRVYNFSFVENASGNAPCPFPGLVVLVYLLSEQHAWSDKEVRARLVELLPGLSEPQDVLQLRRKFEEPIPDTRQLNRILYDLEKQSVALRSPPSGKNQKPRWSLTKPIPGSWLCNDIAS